jgi:hypothetical protein
VESAEKASEGDGSLSKPRRGPPLPSLWWAQWTVNAGVGGLLLRTPTAPHLKPPSPTTAPGLVDQQRVSRAPHRHLGKGGGNGGRHTRPNERTHMPRTTQAIHATRAGDMAFMAMSKGVENTCCKKGWWVRGEGAARERRQEGTQVPDLPSCLRAEALGLRLGHPRTHAPTLPRYHAHSSQHARTHTLLNLTTLSVYMCV